MLKKKKNLLNFRKKKINVLILFLNVNVFLFMYLLKPKKISSSVECFNESNNFSDEEEDGCPLPVVFDSLIGSDPEYSSVSVIKQLKEKFYLYPLSQNIGRYLILSFFSFAFYWMYTFYIFTHIHVFLGS